MAPLVQWSDTASKMVHKQTLPMQKNEIFAAASLSEQCLQIITNYSAGKFLFL